MNDGLVDSEASGDASKDEGEGSREVVEGVIVAEERAAAQDADRGPTATGLASSDAECTNRAGKRTARVRGQR